MLRNLKELKHFLGNWLFGPCDPYVTFDPTVVIWHKCHVSQVLMTKSGWNRSKYVEAIGLRSVARRKKERKKEETSKIQYPAGVSGRVMSMFWLVKRTSFANSCGSSFLNYWILLSLILIRIGCQEMVQLYTNPPTHLGNIMFRFKTTNVVF